MNDSPTSQFIEMGVIKMSYESFSDILNMFYVIVNNAFNKFKPFLVNRSEIWATQERKKFDMKNIFKKYIKSKNENLDEYIIRLNNDLKGDDLSLIEKKMNEYIIYLNELISNQCNNLCNKNIFSSYELCTKRCLNINTFISNFLSIIKLKKDTICESTYANEMHITSYSTSYLISQVYSYIYGENYSLSCKNIILEIEKKLTSGDIYFLDLYINKLITLAKTQRRFRKLYNLLFLQ